MVFIEVAVPAQVVFDERTVNEAAFSESAAGKRASAEGAVDELDTYKRSYVEQAPVPIRVFDHTANQDAAESSTFNVQFAKVAVFERALFPFFWE